jgi:predicted transcriptional regulator YheO
VIKRTPDLWKTLYVKDTFSMNTDKYEDELIEALDKSHPESAKQRRLLLILMLKGEGYTNKEVADLLGINRKTVYRYLKEYKDDEEERY